MPLEAFYGTWDNPLKPSEEAFAKRICQACPVLIDCAYNVLGQDEPHGIWAGSNSKEREEILRQAKGNIDVATRYLVTKTIHIDCEISA